jgi:hypothetical protein
MKFGPNLGLATKETNDVVATFNLAVSSRKK